MPVFVQVGFIFTPAASHTCVCKLLNVRLCAFAYASAVESLYPQTVKLPQSEKALSAIVVVSPENVTDFSPVQPLNAEFATCETLSGISISFKLTQFSKASIPIVCTPFSIVTFLSEVQFSNIRISSDSRLPGIKISCNFSHPENTAYSISVRFCGSRTSSRLLHPSKALHPIFATVSGIFIVFRD